VSLLLQKGHAARVEADPVLYFGAFVDDTDIHISLLEKWISYQNAPRLTNPPAAPWQTIILPEHRSPSGF
jgi:hypothetical protein